LEIEITTNVLNDIFGETNRIEIPQEDSIRLRELFHFWTQTRGKKVLGRLLDGEKLRPEIIFLVNEKTVDLLNGLETQIRNGDRLVILSAVTGG